MSRHLRGTRRESPAAPAYPDEIEGLLDDVRQLRATMASDLSAAAAAVDSDQQGVARDIIAADRDDLAALSRHAIVPPSARRKCRAGPVRKLLRVLSGWRRRHPS